MTHNEITEKLGMPSGTLVHIGDIHARQSRISVTHYNKDQYDNYKVQSLTELLEKKPDNCLTWVNNEGADDFCLDIYSTDLSCRHIRNEF